MTPEEMRAKALECQALGRATRDTGLKRMYEVLTSQWRDLADQIDKANPG